MARIPASEIERLKNEVSIERLAEGRGIELKRTGADLVGRCPFHEDKTPSLVVTPSKNLWHCLGACQAGGSVIDWVMKTEGVSFRHAVELLREGLPRGALARAPVKQSTVPKLAAPVALEADDQVALNQAIGYYHETLKASPEALAYLEARGIRSMEAIERFKLGFANRTLGLRLPEKNRKAGAEIRARLQRLGILRESGHEHFNGSLVIPVMDEHGNVSEVYGRKITPGLRPGTPDHLYLPGPHRGVWNVQALAASKEIILCEALIDALTFWCAGFRNVTAAYGVEGFTDALLAAMKHHGTERVLIAYDRDDAGERAAMKLAERLTGEGIDCYRIQFPKGMDANEYALKVQPAAKSLGLAIRKAGWLGKGVAPVRSSEPELVSVSEIVVEPVCALAPAASSLAAIAAKEENHSPQPEPAPPASPMPLAASPLPTAPSAEVAPEVKETEVVFTFGEAPHARRYRVRGLPKNLAYDVLKVNLLAAMGEAYHVDTIDLYSARQRTSFITQAATELRLADEIVKGDLGRVLLKLEALQEEQIRKALEPTPDERAITDAEREAAIELLRSPDLAERILADFEACGIVGERTNKLVGYLAATSRKLDSPLAVVVQSSSAAGKTSLMDAVLAMMPEEERIKYSAMTGQSLFYMGETNLKHKILAIVEEEGASRAAYALKLLQSEGELTIASTGKDPQTGNLVTQEYRVEGPVMMFLTTTAVDIDPELQNRCLVFAIDEGREQTRAIHKLQRSRRTLEGILARAGREDILTVHRNAQRLLRPLAVLNPYAPSLTFPDEATRTRRDHEKYLTLIDTIALLHQYQRQVKTSERRGRPIEYVEVALDDIALANALAHEVLGRSLDDLPPQTRRLLMLIEEMVAARTRVSSIAREALRFSRRDVREATGWSDFQVKVHMRKLEDLEYLLAHRGGRGQTFVYELLYDGAGKDGRLFVPNLIDVEALRHAYDGNPEHQKTELERSRCPQGAAKLPGRCEGEVPEEPHGAGVSGQSSLPETKTHSKGGNGKDQSYVVPLSESVATSAPLAAASR